jgi:hypothetical protein
MRRRRLARALARIVSILPPALAACRSEADPHATLQTRLFSAAVTGSVQITQGGTPGSGSHLHLADDLDLDPADQPELLADFELYGVRLGGSWLPLEFDGKEELDEDEVFRGTTFPAGSRVKSELELETWKLRLDVPAYEGDVAGVRAGAGAYWWEFDLDLRDVDTGVEESRDFSRLLPSLNVATSWRITRGITAGFEAAFAAIDEGRHLWDLDASARFVVARGFAFHLGFRFLRYDLEEDTNDGEINVFGPTFGMSWRF